MTNCIFTEYDGESPKIHKVPNRVLPSCLTHPAENVRRQYKFLSIVMMRGLMRDLKVLSTYFNSTLPAAFQRITGLTMPFTPEGKGAETLVNGALTKPFFLST